MSTDRIIRPFSIDIPEEALVDLRRRIGVVTHGWPDSIIEQLEIIDPPTNPTAHDESASDAFDLVIPSMPGYGFSGKPPTTGWDPGRIARGLGRADDAPRLGQPCQLLNNICR